MLFRSLNLSSILYTLNLVSCVSLAGSSSSLSVGGVCGEREREKREERKDHHHIYIYASCCVSTSLPSIFYVYECDDIYVSM